MEFKHLSTIEKRWLNQVKNSKNIPILSPSAWKIYFNCAAAPRHIASLNLPEQKTNFAAAQGTVAHYIGEQCIKKNLQPFSFIGQTIKEASYQFKVDQNMVDAVQVYVDYINNLINDTFDYTLYPEKTYSLAFTGLPGLKGGTGDCVFIDWDNKRIYIIDYKHGAGVPVHVFDNGQAWQYAFAVREYLLNEIPTFNDDEFEYTSVIIQPRCSEVPAIQEQTKTEEELLDWFHDSLTPKIIATYNPDAAFNPTPEGCMFCPAQDHCPERDQQAMNTMMLDFESCVDDFDDEETTISLPSPKILTAQQKLAIWKNRKLIHQFLNSVTIQIGAEVMNGSTDYKDDLKMVQSNSKRKYIDGIFEDDFNPVFDYLDEDEIYTKKPKGLGDLELALKHKMKQQGVKSFVKQSKEVMNTITTKQQGYVTLAPLSDRRESIYSTVQVDFDHLLLEHSEDDSDDYLE